MSEWIEIFEIVPSFSTHNCLTLYEWVDWNIIGNFFVVQRNTSHSIWVSGLKCTTKKTIQKIAQSHSIWVSGLKLKKRQLSQVVARSHSIWVSGLKSSSHLKATSQMQSLTLYEWVDWNLPHLFKLCHFVMSHSIWVSGLKSVSTSGLLEPFCVSLYMSEWIEIFTFNVKSEKGGSLTLYEWVDWNMFSNIKVGIAACLTLYEWVDWNRLHALCSLLFQVSLYMSEWIEMYLSRNAT